uniref:Uncharacterized protein n=1 Tax=Heterorhabditis bacteriophora TaxID=37862 RepID=A0A1I7WFS3_HETBA
MARNKIEVPIELKKEDKENQNSTAPHDELSPEKVTTNQFASTSKPGESCKSSNQYIPPISYSRLICNIMIVSHHPPISAFYAEHPGKRISFHAHIYTKSSFLGLSIGLFSPRLSLYADYKDLKRLFRRSKFPNIRCIYVTIIYLFL